jgi:hypothetical protein
LKKKLAQQITRIPETTKGKMKLLRKQIEETKGVTDLSTRVKDTTVGESMAQSEAVSYYDEESDTLSDDSGSNTSLQDNRVKLTEKTIWSDTFLHNITSTCQCANPMRNHNF